MAKTIEQLNSELAEVNSDMAKIELKSQIEEYTASAETAIRKHQREVDYDTKEFTVEMVVNKYKEGLGDDVNELFVPDYQRDFVWSEDNKSRLIESLMIGLPIPHIFIADVESSDPDLDGRVEIVDGSQRVRTLHAFLSGNLKLEGLKLIPEINGFRYSDFPASRQRRFSRISIRIIELSNCTEVTRRDLFERINTGSDELKAMEVRKGSIYGGSRLYKEVIAVCADNDDFKNVVPLSEVKKKRGEDLEFTLRFFAYLENYNNFDHSVREFLDQYLEVSATPDDDRVESMVSVFDRTMLFAKNYFPYGFKKTSGSKTTPRVRFEALAVGVALALEEEPGLVPDDISEWLFSDRFKELTTGDASNSKPRVVARIEYVRDQLLAGV
jgi:head-tail adaptor